MSGELVPVLDGELLPVDAAVVDPVDELYAEWLARLNSAHSRDAYARDLRLFTDWVADYLDVGLLAIRGVHMAAYKEWLRARPGRGGRAPSDATVRRRLAVVSSFYDFARRRELVARNPVEYIDRPESDPDNSETRWLTLEEAQRLVATAFGLVARTSKPDSKRVADRDSVIVAVMLSTGARVSEVCAMRVEDVGYAGGRRVVHVKRKGGKRAPLVLGAATALVDARIADRSTGFLFPTRSGRPVQRAWVYRAIRRVATAAAIPDPATVSPHSLRHTFATLALERGCSLDVLQDALGHRDPRTTRRYAHARNRVELSPAHDVSRAVLGAADQAERLF